MDIPMMQFLLEDEDEYEFDELMNTCVSKSSLMNEDDALYKEIEASCFKLACDRIEESSETDSISSYDENEPEFIENSNSDFKKIKINAPYRLSHKRKRLRADYFSPKGPSEFVDSDVEDELIEKFLRSKKKKTMSKVIAPPSPDPRISLKEIRMLNPFEDRSDEEFFEALRVTKTTYEQVLSKLKRANLFSSAFAGGNFPIQADQALQMFLYYMGHRCTYKYLSQLYRISESAIMSSFLKCVSGINQLDEHEVRWPTGESQLAKLRDDFEQLSGLPGVIGSLGGACVEMRTNKEPPAGYKIGKLRSIMHLLAVADASLRFVYLQAGFPGTFSLQEALESSSLGDLMRTNPAALFVDPDSHIMGGSDFTLNSHLLVPYGEDEQGDISSEAQTTFNEKVALASDVGSRALTRLKERFTSLRTQVYANLEKIPNIVKACCVIHNIALRDEADDALLRQVVENESVLVVPEDDASFYASFRDDSDFVPAAPDTASLRKRDEIAKRVFNNV